MGRRTIYNDSWNKEIVKLYKSGMSLYEIHQTIGIHPEVCKRKLKKLGIEIRNRSDALTNYHLKRRNNGDPDAEA